MQGFEGSGVASWRPPCCFGDFAARNAGAWAKPVVQSPCAGAFPAQGVD